MSICLIVFAQDKIATCAFGALNRGRELRRRSIFALRRIRWEEIVTVKQVGFGYQVISKDNKIVLSPYAYKHPGSVISMLKSLIQDGQSKPKTDQVPD
jgi:hypothetical protein